LLGSFLLLISNNLSAQAIDGGSCDTLISGIGPDISFSEAAHDLVGRYEGQTKNGETCAIEIDYSTLSPVPYNYFGHLPELDDIGVTISLENLQDFNKTSRKTNYCVSVQALKGGHFDQDLMDGREVISIAADYRDIISSNHFFEISDKINSETLLYLDNGELDSFKVLYQNSSLLKKKVYYQKCSNLEKVDSLYY
jgi:hypothetical protein